MGRRFWPTLIAPTAGAALLVAAGVAWSAGSVPAGAAAEARKGGTLLFGSEFDVGPVDPALYGSPEIGFATCAKLFNYPDKPGAAGTRLIPEVVRKTTVSADGRVYTFDLKRTFRFHTGARVTARSFFDAFNRDANPRMASPATGLMQEIVGAVAVMEGKARTISGVRVLGRYRLQFRLTRPVGDFRARLTVPFFCPILPNTPIVPEGIDNPAGSGPYYVAERIPDRRIVLKRNPFYGGDRPANVDQVVWTIGESRLACLRAAEQDLIDHCGLGDNVPVETYRRLAAQYGTNRPGGQFFVVPWLQTTYLAFNHDRPAFKGPGQIALKKALNYAIDRKELVRVFGYLANRRTDQILPPELGREARIYPLAGADPATARKWYAKAKHKPRTLVLYTGNNQRGVALAETLSFNLKKIGIDVDERYYDWGVVYQKVGIRREPFDIVLAGWIADYADPANFIEPLLDPDLRKRSIGNYAYYSNPRVTARIAAASRLTGPKRREAWADLEADLLREDPPWAPIMRGTRREFVSKSFGCFVYHPLYGLDLAAACKK